MVFVETSFPRGKIARSTPQEDIHNKKKKDNPHFGAQSLQKKKLKNGKKEKDEKKTNETSFAEKLNYKYYTTETIILCAISKIQQTELIVSLPGRATGKIPITSISDAYTKILEKFVNENGNVIGFKPVDELFKIGQMIYAKVMDNNVNGIILSINPIDIHTDFHHYKLEEGIILNCSVNNIEDHGYIMETGVKNVRAFLSKKNIKEPLSIGEIVTCSIYKITKTTETSTVVLGISKNNTLDEVSEPILNHIVPSVIVKFTISKILSNGLQGTINDWTFDAIVTDNYLSTPTTALTEYIESETFDARILCVLQQTKIIYLTLNLNELLTNDSSDFLDIGTVCNNADILNVTNTGVNILINNKERGFIHFRQNNSKKPYTDIESIKLNYYDKNKLTVRVLDYQLFDRLYICTDNEELINEKYFQLNDIDVGEIVQFTITKVDEIYTGAIGNIISKILPSWCNKKKKNQLTLGTIIPVRVVEKRNYLVTTNLPAFLKNDVNVLLDRNEIDFNLPYVGLIEIEIENSYVIKFFNNIFGYINKTDIKSKLVVGNAMEFIVKKINLNNSLQLSLPDSKYYDDNGKIFKATITSKSEIGMDIIIQPDIDGHISNFYLSEHPSLAKLMFDVYKENKKVKCVKLFDNNYSIRDTTYFENNPIKTITEIKCGDVLRGFVKNITEETVEVFSPIKNFNNNIILKIPSLIKNNENFTINLVQDQIVYIKVEKITINNKLICSGNIEDVWKCTMNETITFFENYMNDIKKIHKYQAKINNKLGKYQIGEKVKGRALSIDSKTKIMKIDLYNGTVGYIRPDNYSKRHKINTEIDCCIIWIDFQENFIDLTTEEVTIKNDVKYQKQSFKGRIILIKDDVIIAKLKMDDILIFMPKRIHYNDFFGMIDSYIETIPISLYIFPSNLKEAIGIIGSLKEYIDFNRKSGVMDGNDILAKVLGLDGSKNKRKFDNEMKNIKNSITEEPHVKKMKTNNEHEKATSLDKKQSKKICKNNTKIKNSVEKSLNKEKEIKTNKNKKKNSAKSTIFKESPGKTIKRKNKKKLTSETPDK